MPKVVNYIYNGFCFDVYDGDTISVDIDLGCNIIKAGEKIRLYGIDTPEIRTKDLNEKAAGFQARDWLRSKILDQKVIIETIKDKSGKFGRLLGIIYTADGEMNLNQEMVRLGLAEVYHGGKRKK